MNRHDFDSTQPLPLILTLAAQQPPDEPRPLWWRLGRTLAHWMLALLWAGLMALAYLHSGG